MGSGATFAWFFLSSTFSRSFGLRIPAEAKKDVPGRAPVVGCSLGLGNEAEEDLITGRGDVGRAGPVRPSEHARPPGAMD